MIKLEALTTNTERAEYFKAVKQTAILKSEKPQSDFRGGWLRMWTIQNPWYDTNGWNRQHSTFTIRGLTELGIVKGVQRD